MADIVQKLRDRDAVVMAGLFHAIPVMAEAAAEIERLREALQKIMLATELPHHKLRDTDFLRAGCNIANAFAEAALPSTERS